MVNKKRGREKRKERYQSMSNFNRDTQFPDKALLRRPRSDRQEGLGVGDWYPQSKNQAEVTMEVGKEYHESI